VTGYLVDTNILSELTRPLPEPQVEAFLRRSKGRVFVSVLSIGEIRKGIASLPTSNRRAVLEDWLDNEIMAWFADRVLPVTLAVAEQWGVLAAQSKTKGRPRPVIDGIIAATDLKHDLVMATRNVGDFKDRGVTILNPWETVMGPGSD
jgi:predicted nucleic acid-binding protein